MAKGRCIPVSPFRRLVADLMHFSQKVPAVALDRTMNLAPIIAARQAAPHRPTWTSLFTRAYALIARDWPVLRQAWMTFPWTRIYEHPNSVATLNIERQMGDETIVLYCLISRPENRSLAEIDEIIRFHKEAPLEEVRSYTRAMTLARLPGFVRRFVWWGGLNIFARQRCHNFGTFGLTTTASHGAGILQLVPLLTSTIHYGMFDKAGNLHVRMSIDHRVMDGATAARILCELEQLLNTEMVQECSTAPRIAA